MLSSSVMEKGILKNAAIISNRDCSVLSSTPGFEPTTRDMIEINKAELGHLHMNVFQEKYAVRYLADNQIFADKVSLLGPLCATTFERWWRRAMEIADSSERY